jgi:hypothetical protein
MLVLVPGVLVLALPGAWCWCWCWCCRCSGAGCWCAGATETGETQCRMPHATLVRVMLVLGAGRGGGRGPAGGGAGGAGGGRRAGCWGLLGLGLRSALHFLNVPHKQQAVENHSIICQIKTEPSSWTTAAAIWRLKPCERHISCCRM